MSSTAVARRLRKDQTPAERRFWTIMESYRSDGWHVRRQAPIGPYIADFVCKRARVVFEIDGDSHYSDAGIAADRERTAYLESRGYRMVRFTNLDVMTRSEGVWYEVGVALKNTPT